MAQALSETTLLTLSVFLAKEMGLLFPRGRWGELESGLRAAARQLGRPDAEECARWLTSAPLTRSQVETLAAFLTVGETYFFRDPQTFQAVEREILPALIRARRGKDQRLRLWSAGCSTGEEPYSLAILLNRLLPDLAEWNVTLLATDINPAALKKAMTGVYGNWSFRGAPSSFQTLYFTREGEGRFRVAERVGRLVSFEYLNLAEDGYPSLASNTNAMDLIFCRNVLMYFAPEVTRGVVGKLHRSLVADGWLVLGPAEHLPARFAPFRAVNFAGSLCYRKTEAEPPRVAPIPGHAPPEQPTAQIITEPQPGAGPAEPPASPGALPESGREYREALALYREGRYQQAAERLGELQDRNELPAEGVPLLIRAHANRGALSEALMTCEEALGRDKLDPALHLLRAEILQEQGRLDEAQATLKRALFLDPGLVLAHFALGNLTLWSGSPERARKHFANALELLAGVAPDAILPGSEGLTAGRLREIILPGSSGTGAGQDGRP